MNGRVPLEIIVFPPRGYTAIVMAVRQKAVVTVLLKGFGRRLSMTSSEHGGKSRPMCREYKGKFSPIAWLNLPCMEA